jgi:hypothetical protein
VRRIPGRAAAREASCSGGARVVVKSIRRFLGKGDLFENA